MIKPAAFRRALLAWFDAHRRDLPWRASTDFYRVWVSEIMLQQTRVEAVIPFYLRFLERFPDVMALAHAPEEDVLAAWSGLGYYSRARNLHRAAKRVQSGALPVSYEELLALPGAGPYTAAAIGSIAFNLKHAAVDGNVMRVVSRLTNDASEVTSSEGRAAFAAEAERLLDPARPGDFNQAMMELGAMVCVPAAPRCGDCPVAGFCAARRAGTQSSLPVRRPKPKPRDVEVHFALLERDGHIFLVRRSDDEPRLAGFWELPGRELFGARGAQLAAEFSHRIVNDRYRVAVWRVGIPRRMPEGRWFEVVQLGMVPLTAIPLTAVTRKAVRWITCRATESSRL